MKKIIFVMCTVSFLFSCSYLGLGPEFDTKEAMTDLVKDINKHVTDKGGWNDLTFIYDKRGGNTVLLTFTPDTTSKNWVEYSRTRGVWSKKSDVTCETDANTLPSDFLLKVKDFDFMSLLPMFEQAKNKVINDKGIKDVIISYCSVSMTKNRNSENKLEDINIAINVTPKNGGTEYQFTFDVKGKLLNFTNK